MSVWDIGDQVRLGNYSGSGKDAFKNLAGVATNPSAVTIRIRKPDNTLLVYGWPVAGISGSVVQEAGQDGRFYVDVSWDVPGVWKCRMEGTGAVVATVEWTETVKRSVVL